MHRKPAKRRGGAREETEWCPKGRRVRAQFFLAQTAVYPAGYRVRGAYGWVHPNDLNLLAGSYTWADLLSELERDGRVTAQVASLAEAAEAAWLYRITQEGMNEIASAVGQKPPTVTPPGASE